MTSAPFPMWKVRAKNADGWGPLSAVYAFATSPVPSDINNLTWVSSTSDSIQVPSMVACACDTYGMSSFMVPRIFDCSSAVLLCRNFKGLDLYRLVLRVGLERNAIPQ
eukprot:462778-Amphidinium_carterae.2